MRWLLLLALATLPPSDHTAFQQCFTFLAESQFSVDPASRPAALVRFAYREALRTHAAAWVASTEGPLVVVNRHLILEGST